jgi:arylsulfatase
VSDQPNLVLVLVDQWRADALSSAGHGVVETPHIDALFAHGTTFERAYSSVPSCIAARAALLTGLDQVHHGRVGYEEGVAWPYPVTLPSVLRDAGYQTWCVGKMHVAPQRARLGFDDVVLHDGYIHFWRDRTRDLAGDDDYLTWLRTVAGPDADIIDQGLGPNGYVVRPWTAPDRLHPTSWVVREGIDFLRRRDSTRPFFLTLSFHRPHPPLDPPAWLLERYERKTLEDIPVGDWVGESAPSPSPLPDSPVPTDRAAIDRARRAYFAQLSFIDIELNRFFTALGEHKLGPNTAIVFVSDHGEMLYDHHRVGKAVPYEASSRVPLLVAPPPSWGEQWPAAVVAPVELRDLLPTFAALAGVAPEPGVDGASLLPLVRDSRDAPWREYLHGEHVMWGPLSNQWLTDGRTKYIWFPQSGAEQLFDLERDPDELVDLADSSPGVVAVWRQRLVDTLVGREEGFVVDGALITGRPQEPVLASSGILDDAALARRAEIAAFIAAAIAKSETAT